MKIYFAHPINIYNTFKENHLVLFITDYFRGSEIVNPNSIKNEEGYRKEGMEYFLKMVDECNCLIIYPFEDNTIGAGIVKEALRASDANKTIYQINPKDWSIRKIEKLENCLSVEETRKKLKEITK